MKKTGLFFAALAAAAIVVSPVAVNAEETTYEKGWQQDGKGWWYQFEDGTYAKDGYYSLEDDYETAYMFDENGYMTTGWYYDYNEEYNGGSWYYSDSHGVLQDGWQKIDGTWYYFSESSYYMACDGSRTIYADDNDTKGTKYWFEPSGAMITGWYNYAPYSTYGDWVYCNSDGSAYDGWLKENGKWYYINKGDMIASSTILYCKAADGSTYYDTYAHSQYDDKGNWIGNDEIVDRYYFGRDGVMVEGWYYAEYEDATGYKSNSWLYANGGVIKSGWVKSGNDWYYTEESGYMLRDTRVYMGDYDETINENAPKAPEYPDAEDYRKDNGYIDWDAYDAAWDAYEAAYDQYLKDYRAYRAANTYVFDANGKMVTGWYGSKNTYGTTWYYCDSNGSAHDGWVKDGGNWYYIDRGLMLRNQYTPDGYFVDNNGVCK